MHSTWFFGLLMVLTPGVIDWSSGWVHLKAACVILMTIIHAIFGLWVKKFRQDQQRRPQRHYRIANEIPTLLMIVIVFMVVAKPF